MIGRLLLAAFILYLLMGSHFNSRRQDGDPEDGARQEYKVQHKPHPDSIISKYPRWEGP